MSQVADQINELEAERAYGGDGPQVQEGVFGTTAVVPVPAEITTEDFKKLLCGDVYDWAVTSLGVLATGVGDVNVDSEGEHTWLIPFDQIRRIELFPEAYDEVVEAFEDAERDARAAELLAKAAPDTAESVQADAESS